jgi:hypothetical protein
MDYNDKKNITGGLLAKQPAEDFAVRSATTAAGFNTDDADPPWSTYVGLDDLLLIGLADFVSVGQIVQINVRILRPDGIIVPLKFTVKCAATRAFVFTTQPMVEGWLLSITAIAPGLGLGAWAFLTCSIQRNPLGSQNQYETLLAGDLNSGSGMVWPASVTHGRSGRMQVCQPSGPSGRRRPRYHRARGRALARCHVPCHTYVGGSGRKSPSAPNHG